MRRSAQQRSTIASVVGRSVAAATLVAGLLVLPTSPAGAAGPRPFFQMPVPCGQTWEASTYGSHWPDQDSIDLGRWTGNTNISKGTPVLASANGTVADVFVSGGGDIRVYLDHGNGWTTHYIHLETLPPLTKGQAVAQGQQIGTVGNTGTKAYHLHYTQLQDGVAVRAQFNGATIATGQTNPDSWGTWGDGEVMTSLNCPQNSFLSGYQDGKQSLTTYKPGTGQVSTHYLKDGGQGVTTQWTGTWSKGWTHLAPFVHGASTRGIVYASASGAVGFESLKPLAAGYTEVGAGNWAKGWTTLMPFQLGTTNYYVAYNSLTGATNIDRINAVGNGATPVSSANWGKGWTHLVPFRLGGAQYFIAYQGGTGAVVIDKLTGSGNSISLQQIWTGTWSKNWSHLVPLVQGSSVYLLRYSSSNGAASYDKVKAGGAGIDVLGSGTWSKSWTTFSPVKVGTGAVAHVLIHKTGTGDTKVMKLNAGGASMTAIWSGKWSLGWT